MDVEQACGCAYGRREGGLRLSPHAPSTDAYHGWKTVVKLDPARALSDARLGAVAGWTPDALCPGFDLYFIPTVLNSTEADWVLGHHHAAVKRPGDREDWERVVVGNAIYEAGAPA